MLPEAFGSVPEGSCYTSSCREGVLLLPGSVSIGGGGGIRTHGPLARPAVFKTAALDRSATPPETLTPRPPLPTAPPSAGRGGERPAPRCGRAYRGSVISARPPM